MSYGTVSGERAYSFKHIGRDPIVGEPTGGGAHPTRVARIDDQFVVGVPLLRAHNPITRINWEGGGVQPDILVSADEALPRATRAAWESRFGEPFSREFRSARSREDRSDEVYAADWFNHAAGRVAVPVSCVSHDEAEISVFVRLIRSENGSSEWRRFRLRVDPEPQHGLRSITITNDRPPLDAQ